MFAILIYLTYFSSCCLEGCGKEELRYLDDWETARRDQNILKIKKDEGDYMDTISIYKTKIGYEDRIHTEIQVFIEESKEV